MMSVWGILLLYFPSAKLLLCFHKSSWKPNATVACFTHVFPYLATVSCFPALDSRFTISRAWQPLHDFPRLTSFVYFDMEFWLAHYVVCLAMIGQPTVVGKPLYWYISTFFMWFVWRYRPRQTVQISVAEFSWQQSHYPWHWCAGKTAPVEVFICRKQRYYLSPWTAGIVIFLCLCISLVQFLAVHCITATWNYRILPCGF